MAEKPSSTELSWHAKTWQNFSTARNNDHLPHALLLTGGHGVGKKIFAEKLVKSLLCINPVENAACNNCQACKTYESGANPDYLHIELLEGKQQIGVDQIRSLSEFLNYTRSFAGYRVVLLNPVERMNKNAANSLLKSLEEPTDNTIIILLATNLSNIIPTIKSRCQLLTLAMPSKEQAHSWLKDNKPEISNVEELLDMANGSPLLAAEIPEDLLKARNEFGSDIDEVISEKRSVTEIAKKWEKHDHESLLNWQISWIQELIKNTSTKVQYTTKISSNFEKKLASKQQWQLHQQLIQKKHTIHTSVNPLINLESMLLLWLQASKPTN